MKDCLINNRENSMRILFLLFSLIGLNIAIADDVIVFNKDHYIVKDVVGDYVELSIEFLSDYENDFEGKYPTVDFASIYVDSNGNSKIDPKVDRYYSFINGKNMCSGFLMGEGMSLPCGSFDTKAKVFTYFLKSEVQPMPHPVIKYLIPIEELFGNNDFSYVVIQSYNKVIGYTTYPGEKRFKNFDVTIRLKK